MNGETRIGMLMHRTAWNCTRERFRATRSDVFIVCQQSAARVVTRIKHRTMLVAPVPSMDGVVFYDSGESAAEAADAMEKLANAVMAAVSGGKPVDAIELIAIPAYEYAKAREYACRNELAGAGVKS